MRKTLLYLLFCFLSFQLTANSVCEGCDKFNFFNDPPAKELSKPSFSIFPNPAIDFITIADKTDAIREVHVYNLVGRKIKTFYKKANDRYIISDLHKGLYLVQLIGHQGDILTTQRVNKR